MRNKSWHKVHSYIGTTFGLLLFLICWSGTFAVISHEIDWLITPEYRSQSHNQDFEWSTLLGRVNKTFPTATVHSIHSPLNDNASYQAIVSLPNHDLARLYIDPITGKVSGPHSFYNFQRFIRNFHMSLFNPGGIGIYLVTIFALPLIISAISALIFYKKWWRHFFQLPKLRKHSLVNSFHKTFATWSLWLIIIIAVTSLWYLFEMSRVDFIDGKFSYVGIDESAVIEAERPSKIAPLTTKSLQAITDEVERIRPELFITEISANRSHPGALYVEGKDGGVLVRDRASQLHISISDQSVLLNQKVSDYPLYWLWSHMADPLHFGNFAGLSSKLIWFLFGLMMSLTILTGTMVFHKRALRKQIDRSEKLSHKTGLYFAAVLVVIAIFSGFVQAKSAYGTMVNGVQQYPDVTIGVQFTIIVWVALTMILVFLWSRNSHD